MIVDTTFSKHSDLEDNVDGSARYQLSFHLVSSRPCHGLNANEDNLFSELMCNHATGCGENIELDSVEGDTICAGQTGLGCD